VSQTHYQHAKCNSAVAQLTSNDESAAIKNLRMDNERLRLQNVCITKDQKRDLDEYKKQPFAEVRPRITDL